MIISEVIKPNHLKAKSKKPKLIKPNKGHESRNVTRGKLVGEADQPKDDKSARSRLNHSLISQGHQVQKDKKKELKKGTVKHKGKQFNVDEARSSRPDFNFTPEDLHKLQKIDDLNKIKKVALRLIANKESSRPMEPKKVAWFDSALDQKNSKDEVIKMMWHLLLSGEGHKVIGDRYSTKKNSYRVAMGEGTLVFHKESELRGMLDTLLQAWKGQDHTPDEFKALVNALGYNFKQVQSSSGKKIELVKAVQGSIQD